MTSEPNVTSQMAATLVMMSTETNNVPDLYLSSDDRLLQYVEFRAALWIDYVYVPICSALGIAGNLISFCVLLSSRMSGASTSVYMAALAVSDTLVQVCNILWLAQKFPGHEVLRQGTCGFVYFFFFFSIHYSVIVMSGMTIERYLAIRFPLMANRWCTPTKARLAVTVMCVGVVALDFHYLVTMRMVWNDVMKTEACGPDSPESQWFLHMVWPWITSSVNCYIPLATVAVLNVLIVRQMRAAAKFRGSTANTGAAEQADASRHVTVMLLLVTCTFLLLATPVAVIQVVERYAWVRTTLYEQAVFHLTRTICNNLYYTNHAINFLLYCLSGNRFRQEFVRLFLPCFASKMEKQASLQSTKKPSMS
ncbi:neuropeptides B/W receptor type 2-like [Babylonia areolata]|uniref:neuropeptides B/W receptor type 2-like n=1 Tax=Babylonia areolata TaxID=304850 RepID=UPI003FD5049A